MFDSFPVPFLQARLSALSLSAMDKGLLSVDAAARLHMISKTAGDIELVRDRAPASYQEMLFGVATLESELVRHAQRRSSKRKGYLNLKRSLGARSLFLAACAFEAEFETDSAGLDLVIDRGRSALLIGDMADASKKWVSVDVRSEDPEATLQEVRAVREAWDG